MYVFVLIIVFKFIAVHVLNGFVTVPAGCHVRCILLSLPARANRGSFILVQLTGEKRRRLKLFICLYFQKLKVILSWKTTIEPVHLRYVANIMTLAP